MFVLYRYNSLRITNLTKGKCLWQFQELLLLSLLPFIRQFASIVKSALENKPDDLDGLFRLFDIRSFIRDSPMETNFHWADFIYLYIQTFEYLYVYPNILILSDAPTYLYISDRKVSSDQRPVKDCFLDLLFVVIDKLGNDSTK